MFKLNGTQSIFLQVPGFKELQAFLHRQAFLQTLGGEQEKTVKLSPRAGCQPQHRQGVGWGWGGPQRLVGHAKESPSPVRCVIWMRKEKKSEKQVHEHRR